MYRIQNHTRFSESKLWEFQRAYFETTGINAWRSGQVPHYITSNPAMGRTYAGLFFAFLCDLARQGKTLDTVYLLELGAGHGRLCYHFFKHLETLVAGSAQSLPPFCYILSDVAEENINFWNTHPRLQPYLEKGWLDIARVDADKIETIHLQRSNYSISTQSLHQPLVVIANYFFDSIPQELFYVQHQLLHQCLVSLTIEEQYKNSVPAEMLTHLQVLYENQILDQLPYREEYLNSLLAGYTLSLEETYLLFPHTGIRCLHQLRNFSQQGLLLFTADKGYHRKEEVQGKSIPYIATHGSFSLPVNYHCIKEYCVEHRGVALLPKDVSDNILLGCFLFLDADQYRELKQTYTSLVEDFGPDDFYALKKQSENLFRQFDLSGMVSMLKLSNYDARLFIQMFPYLIKLTPYVSENHRWRIFKTLNRIWDTYYPLGEKEDLAQLIGETLYSLNFFDEAMIYYCLSVKIYGRVPDILYNIALCETSLNEYTKARDIVNEILQTNPDHKLSLQLEDYLKTVAS